MVKKREGINECQTNSSTLMTHVQCKTNVKTW